MATEILKPHDVTSPDLTRLPESFLLLKQFAIFYNKVTASPMCNELAQAMGRIQDEFATVEDIKAADISFKLLTDFTADPELMQSSLEKKEPTRAYVDGAFDLIHSGHYNAIRQASFICDELVVGVNATQFIQEVKGPVVLTDEERCQLMSACKFVTHVQEKTPYDVSEEVLDKFECKYYAHGDDPVYNVKGEEITGKLALKGRFKQFQRTPGVSTTSITHKLVALIDNLGQTVPKPTGPPKQHFLQTAQRIKNFANDKRPQPGQTIVYYHASCDLMHPGVIERLRKAKEQGDFLYVGIWDDETVKYYRGEQYPLVCMQERLVMTLSCRYVDDVVLGAPFVLTQDLIKSLNITKVVNVLSADDAVMEQHQDVDAFEAAKNMGIYSEIESNPDELTVMKIAQRVADNKEQFQEKVARKTKQEDEYYERKIPGKIGAM